MVPIMCFAIIKILEVQTDLKKLSKRFWRKYLREEIALNAIYWTHFALTHTHSTCTTGAGVFSTRSR